MAPALNTSRPANGQVNACAAALGLFLAVFAWASWPTLTSLVRRWSLDPQYTHGYVVPLFAALVLWMRRGWFPTRHVGPSWWGVLLLAAAFLCRLAGALYSFEWLEGGSVMLALAGCCWTTLGYRALRWALPAFALMVFILPWPWQLDQLLTYPLRRLATISSTFCLQLLGAPALARGNIIVINDLEVGVVEACSGLGMLMTFFALSTAVAFAADRPRFDKLVIFFSAIPIGILMNIARITVTVFLYQFVSADVARLVFHDVAGWVMMPAALAVLWLELALLSWLWLPAEESRPVPIPLRRSDQAEAHQPSRMADTRPIGELRPLAEQADPLQELPDAAS